MPRHRSVKRAHDRAADDRRLEPRRLMEVWLGGSGHRGEREAMGGGLLRSVCRARRFAGAAHLGGAARRRLRAPEHGALGYELLGGRRAASRDQLRRGPSLHRRRHVRAAVGVVGLLDQAVDHRRVREDRLPLPQRRRLPLVHGRQLRPLRRAPERAPAVGVALPSAVAPP